MAPSRRGRVEHPPASSSASPAAEGPGGPPRPRRRPGGAPSASTGGPSARQRRHGDHDSADSDMSPPTTPAPARARLAFAGRPPGRSPTAPGSRAGRPGSRRAPSAGPHRGDVGEVLRRRLAPDVAPAGPVPAEVAASTSVSVGRPPARSGIETAASSPGPTSTPRGPAAREDGRDAAVPPDVAEAAGGGREQVLADPGFTVRDRDPGVPRGRTPPGCQRRTRGGAGVHPHPDRGGPGGATVRASSPRSPASPSPRTYRTLRRHRPGRGERRRSASSSSPASRTSRDHPHADLPGRASLTLAAGDGAAGPVEASRAESGPACVRSRLHQGSEGGPGHGARQGPLAAQGSWPAPAWGDPHIATALRFCSRWARPPHQCIKRQRPRLGLLTRTLTPSCSSTFGMDPARRTWPFRSPTTQPTGALVDLAPVAAALPPNGRSWERRRGLAASAPQVRPRGCPRRAPARREGPPSKALH